LDTKTKQSPNFFNNIDAGQFWVFNSSNSLFLIRFHTLSPTLNPFFSQRASLVLTLGLAAPPLSQISSSLHFSIFTLMNFFFFNLNRSLSLSYHHSHLFLWFNKKHQQTTKTETRK
ncbi:hypothetical protein CFOL_v3_18304, partial [Cephalotus follicularis]